MSDKHFYVVGTTAQLVLGNRVDFLILNRI